MIVNAKIKIAVSTPQNNRKNSCVQLCENVRYLVKFLHYNEIGKLQKHRR